MIRRIIRDHPLATVLAVALFVRLLAVTFSPGYIHTDDQYDTVDVSYDWLRNGLWGEDGYLKWKNDPPGSITRFPLYTLALYGIMKLFTLFGVYSLNTMMYGIRLFHALLSLLSVWSMFRVVQIVSKDNRWAVVGGLAMALHFAMPFLAVRNLIEMVGGHIWMASLYFIYRYMKEKNNGRLYVAGILTGLAWMIRFPIAFAVLPVPILLWHENRDIKPALHYSAAVLIMLLASGISDKFMMGTFAASTINNLTLNTGLGALYSTIPLMCFLIYALLPVPPLSFVTLYSSAKPRFWKAHKILVFSTLSFIIMHAVQGNQQERFMIPIIPVAILISILALYHQFNIHRYILRRKRLFTAVLSITIVLNLLLLIPLTFAHARKGLIEPLLKFESMDPKPVVMFVQPEMKYWIPLDYAGFEPLPKIYIRQWQQLRDLPNRYRVPSAIDYFVLYPVKKEDTESYIDSLENIYGALIPVYHIEPSYYDLFLHKLNPRHNYSFEAYVYKPSGT